MSGRWAIHGGKVYALNDGVYVPAFLEGVEVEKERAFQRGWDAGYNAGLAEPFGPDLTEGADTG